MLYDSKQGVRARLMELRDWLQKRDPKGGYSWRSMKNCLMCQFTGLNWKAFNSADFGGPDVVMEIAFGPGTARYENYDPKVNVWTYGAALKRLDDILAKQFNA